jgi:hypothetical protein
MGVLTTIWGAIMGSFAAVLATVYICSGHSVIFTRMAEE